MTVKVSVLLPVFNGEKYIKEAVDSVLSQTFTDFELLILDGGSTDNTLNILKAYNDKRLRIVPCNSGSIAGDLNQGYKQAKGEYIARMDGDDICMPERFAKQVKYLDTHPECDALGTAYKHFYNSAELNRGQTKRPGKQQKITNKDHLLTNDRPFIAHPTAMMRKTALEKIADNGNIYRPQFVSAEDCDLWLRFSEHTILHNLDDVLLKYRVRKNSLTYTNEAKSFLYAFFAMVNSYERMSGEPETIWKGEYEGIKQAQKKYYFSHNIWLFFLHEKYFNLNDHYKIFGFWKKLYMFKIAVKSMGFLGWSVNILFTKYSIWLHWAFTNHTVLAKISRIIYYVVRPFTSRVYRFIRKNIYP